eukprot:2781747-Prymnesium_polylepis.1
MFLQVLHGAPGLPRVGVLLLRLQQQGVHGLDVDVLGSKTPLDKSVEGLAKRCLLYTSDAADDM